MENGLNRYRDWNAEEATGTIARHRDLPGAMLPILHALQEAFGCIDKEAVPLIAEALNVSRAEVHGVVTFYHDFREAPPGRHVLRLCRAEACQSVGCEALVRHAEVNLGAKLGETTVSGEFTLEAVYCLGNCALGPSAMLDGKLHGRLSPARLDRLLSAARNRP